MIDKQLRFEIVHSINQIKSLLREAEKVSEISPHERKLIMSKLGEVKQIMFSDFSFKQVYLNEYQNRVKLIR